MDWKSFPFIERLNATFTTPKIQLPGGTIWVGEAPFTVFGLMEEIEPAQNLESDRDIESERQEVSEKLWRRCRWTTLIEFDWGSSGGVASLCLVDAGLARGFVGFVHEAWSANDDTRPIVAAVEPNDSSDVFGALVRDLISDNGLSYGVEMFGSLPERATNYHPDLIPRESVQDAFEGWMDQADDSLWVDLRDSVISRSIEPAVIPDLAETLAELRTFIERSPDPARALEQYLSTRDKEAGSLTEEDRQRIFKIWFAQAYREK